MGTVLVILVAGMLAVDQHLAPWYPFLFVFVLGLALAACYELLHLLGPARRPLPWICYGAVAGLILANWVARLVSPEAMVDSLGLRLPATWGGWILGVFTVVVMAVFLAEMAMFREPGNSVVRMALGIWIASYLGVLPSFFVQLRWLDEANRNVGTTALALAVFVPKGCDIGAYFTGRLIGRHPMTPVLSPKKTWEGAAGGLATAILAAILLDRFGPAEVLRGNLAWEVGFGVTVGIAGMLGDLAESLIKRDCGQKDASQVVPGFGGVLDVVDAVIFAAPVAYCWLSVPRAV
jgi:phosphatidate cytidylyltransferase